MTDAATDYDRACLVSHDIDTINSREGREVIVLGDEPDSTAIRCLDDIRYLIRWRASDSDRAMEDALDSKLQTLRFERNTLFQTAPGTHVLFDSAFAGWTTDASLTCDLGHGAYAVDSATLRDGSTLALIHRLTPFAG